MSMFIKSFLTLLPLLVICTVSNAGLRPDVHDFIKLLTREAPPSLAEYSRFSGECGGETELIFETKECHAKGWKTNSRACIDFTQRRCQLEEQEVSLVLSWLRKKFSTAGKRYDLLSVISNTDDLNYELIKVKIGQNTFVLLHYLDSNPPGGMTVAVSRINGKEIREYLK